MFEGGYVSLLVDVRGEYYRSITCTESIHTSWSHETFGSTYVDLLPHSGLSNLQFSNHLSLFLGPLNKPLIEIAASAGLAKESNDMKIVVRGKKEN